MILRTIKPLFSIHRTTTTTSFVCRGNQLSAVYQFNKLNRFVSLSSLSASASQTKTRHLQPTLAPTQKFSPRAAQIASHFSSSPSSSLSENTSPNNNTNMASQYKTRKVAAPNTLEHRIYIEKDGVPISAFHDIPLYANEAQTILNMVVEIPRWTNAKMEISKVWEFIYTFLCLNPWDCCNCPSLSPSYPAVQTQTRNSHQNNHTDI